MTDAVGMPRDDEIDVYGTTHAGRVREHNEDNFLLCSFHKSMRVHATSLPGVDEASREPRRLGFLVAVADGLGGLAKGEEASRLAIESVTEYATHCMDCYYEADPGSERRFLEQLHRAVEEAHVEVRGRTLEVTGGRRMATTMTLLLTHWPKMYVVQIGDSRCYVLHHGELIRVTRDQTLAQSLIDSGSLTPEQAERSPFAHILSSAIGSDALNPVSTALVFDPADVILLCSDGLTRHVSDEEIEDHLRRLRSAEATTHELVELALERGGRDNITVVIGCLKR